MNENLNLVEILKDCPKGTKLYSPLFGEVEFEKIKDGIYPIAVKTKTNPIEGECIEQIRTFSSSGILCLSFNGECVLFPSKDQRDWSKFRPKQSKQTEGEEWCESQKITKWAYISDLLPKSPKFDPKTLKPFDKVLVRRGSENYDVWFPDFVSYPPDDTDNKTLCMCVMEDMAMVIPYNEDTKKLVGTTDEAPEYYRYWED